jgi:hypothetical protein
MAVPIDPKSYLTDQEKRSCEVEMLPVAARSAW